MNRYDYCGPLSYQLVCSQCDVCAGNPSLFQKIACRLFGDANPGYDDCKSQYQWRIDALLCPALLAKSWHELCAVSGR